MQAFLQVIDVLLKVGVLLEGGLNFVDGMEDGRMVLATKLIPDLW